MTYVVKVQDDLGVMTEVYNGDDPIYAMDIARMLREEEPSEVRISIHLAKD